MKKLRLFRSLIKYSCWATFLILAFTIRERFLRQPGEFADEVYTSVAYLLSSRHIRVIIVKKCDDYGGLNLTTDNDAGEEVNIFGRVTPYHDECPWKGCTYEGFFTDFYLESDFKGDKIILSTGTERSVNVTVRKAIPLNDPSHFLSVCVAAMSYYDNSAQLIRFIEYWKLVGTTKFFFYWQSITQDIQNIIDLYQKNSGIDIEMVAWPRLPEPEIDQEFYYTGQLTSINDCLHRARGHAKFVAIVDFDEYIMPFSGSLIDMLEQVDANTAGLLFYSSFAHIGENTDEISMDPERYNFSEWTRITLDKNVDKDRSKVIVKPEMIRRGNIHFIEEYEGNARKTVVMPPEKAIIVHFRAFNRFTSAEFIESNIFAIAAERMAHHWQKRIKTVLSSPANFKITEGHRQIYEKINNCLAEIWSWSNETCFTVSRCSITQLFDNITTHWRFATESWLRL